MLDVPHISDPRIQPKPRPLCRASGVRLKLHTRTADYGPGLSSP